MQDISNFFCGHLPYLTKYEFYYPTTTITCFLSSFSKEKQYSYGLPVCLSKITISASGLYGIKDLTNWSTVIIFISLTKCGFYPISVTSAQLSLQFSGPSSLPSWILSRRICSASSGEVASIS